MSIWKSIKRAVSKAVAAVRKVITPPKPSAPAKSSPPLTSSPAYKQPSYTPSTPALTSSPSYKAPTVSSGGGGGSSAPSSSSSGGGGGGGYTQPGTKTTKDIGSPIFGPGGIQPGTKTTKDIGLPFFGPGGIQPGFVQSFREGMAGTDTAESKGIIGDIGGALGRAAGGNLPGAEIAMAIPSGISKLGGQAATPEDTTTQPMEAPPDQQQAAGAAQ